MRKRNVWVEPLFAEAKDWHGLRRFRQRRLWRVNCEALLIAAGQNLKRLLSKRGWGRRPLPSGAAIHFVPADEGFWVSVQTTLTVKQNCTRSTDTLNTLANYQQSEAAGVFQHTRPFFETYCSVLPGGYSPHPGPA